MFGGEGGGGGGLIVKHIIVGRQQGSRYRTKSQLQHVSDTSVLAASASWGITCRLRCKRVNGDHVLRGHLKRFLDPREMHVCAWRKGFLFFLSCVPPQEGGVAYVTVFNSSATWAATFRLRGYKYMLVVFVFP